MDSVRIDLSTPRLFALAMLTGTAPLRTIVRQLERCYKLDRKEAERVVADAFDEFHPDLRNDP